KSLKLETADLMPLIEAWINKAAQAGKATKVITFDEDGNVKASLEQATLSVTGFVDTLKNLGPIVQAANLSGDNYATAMKGVVNVFKDAFTQGQFTVDMFNKLVQTSPQLAQALSSVFHQDISEFKKSLDQYPKSFNTIMEAMRLLGPAAQAATKDIADNADMWDHLNKAWGDLKTGKVIEMFADLGKAWDSFVEHLTEAGKGDNAVSKWVR